MAANNTVRGIHLKVLFPLLLVLASCSGQDGGMEAVKQRIAELYPGVPQWTISEAREAMEEDPPPVILDVREPAEYKVSHLPGAVRVAPNAEAEEVMDRLPENRDVLLYCSVGYRSSELARRLRAAGREKVHNLAGSIFEWANHGLPLVNAEGPTEKVHGYNARWERYLGEERRK